MAEDTKVAAPKSADSKAAPVKAASAKPDAAKAADPKVAPAAGEEVNDIEEMNKKFKPK